jgi:hypothetical protein
VQRLAWSVQHVRHPAIRHLLLLALAVGAGERVQVRLYSQSISDHELPKTLPSTSITRPPSASGRAACHLHRH